MFGLRDGLYAWMPQLSLHGFIDESTRYSSFIRATMQVWRGLLNRLSELLDRLGREAVDATTIYRNQAP